MILYTENYLKIHKTAKRTNKLNIVHSVSEYKIKCENSLAKSKLNKELGKQFHYNSIKNTIIPKLFQRYYPDIETKGFS